MQTILCDNDVIQTDKSTDKTDRPTKERDETRKHIWIDLDNSPHVPLFAPIIRDLRNRGHLVTVTGRDCFQVAELAQLLGVECDLIGRHYGEKKLWKLVGLGIRAMQLSPSVLRRRPDLALSHGSRAQLLLCSALRVPSIVMIDYEFVSGLTLMRPTWVMLPGSIPDQAVGLNPNQILRYPGIKEDIYVPGFSPDRKIRSALGVAEEDILVTLRPPANEAHYHNPESEVLLDAVLGLLRKEESTRIVLLPRNARQGEGIRNAWPDMFKSGKIIVPSHTVDGLSLVWQSDLVISGGGTMNREAAALGVPVYSIFRGRIGAVDRHLADTKRLVLIEKVKDVQEKIDLRRRDRNGKKDFGTDSTRAQIIRNIERALAQKSTSKNRYL